MEKASQPIPSHYRQNESHVGNLIANRLAIAASVSRNPLSYKLRSPIHMSEHYLRHRAKKFQTPLTLNVANTE